jgi:predicted transcriptional regulator
MSRNLFATHCRLSSKTWVITNYRDTLIFVENNRNITLSLPRELLRRVKRIAADRDTSVSSMMIEALTRLADEDRRYSAARKRALAALRSARSLGTGGHGTWARDELHER